jgi:hypothetical protein
VTIVAEIKEDAALAQPGTQQLMWSERAALNPITVSPRWQFTEWVLPTMWCRLLTFVVEPWRNP